MSLLIIDSKVLERLKEEIEKLSKMLEVIQAKDNQEEWLDNQDVCLKLNICLRTLQSYRDSGKLPFSMIGHKCYYKASDIEVFMEKLKVTNRRK